MSIRIPFAKPAASHCLAYAFTLLVALALAMPGQEQKPPAVKTRKLVVIGSSLAAGWVTSLEERHDFQNGFAQRLNRHLTAQGWTVIVSAQPGDTTADVLKRLETDLIAQHPDCALVALSLGNEGLSENADLAVENYKKGMLEIVSRLKTAGIQTILGSCYASNLYTAEQYRRVKETNLWLNSLGLPLINLLGALEDGHGHFPEELLFDHSHPLNRGHEELFYAIPPGLFLGDTLPAVPADDLPERGVVLPAKAFKQHLLSYIPSQVMHPFSMAFSVKATIDGPLAEIDWGPESLRLNCEQGLLVCSTASQQLQSTIKITDGAWHTVTVSHRHLPGLTTLYLDGSPLGQLTGSRIPRQFILGPRGARGVSLRNLLIYRAALNDDEAALLSRGKLWRGSLEVFSPLDEAVRAKQTVKNLAPAEAPLIPLTRKFTEPRARIEAQIEAGQKQQREETVFPEKKTITLPPFSEGRYVGCFEIAPGDRVNIDWRGNTFYIVDRGQNQDIYPETAERFFIRHPLMEIEILFSDLTRGAYNELKMTINGQLRLAARRVTPDHSQSQKLIQTWAKTIPQRLKKAGVPGLSIVVCDRAGPIWGQGFGLRDLTGRQAVDTDTVFGLQAASQSFTAAAILLAVRQGLLELDAPINRYLPEFTVHSRFEESPQQRISLRHLLTHRSGLVDEAPHGNHREPAYNSFAEHIASISDTSLLGPVGETIQYSELGFDLAGYILQTVSRTDFCSWMQHRLLEPLGMDNSSFSWGRTDKNPNRATGYLDGKSPAPFSFAMIPAGGLYASATDVCRFLSHQLRQGSDDELMRLTAESTDPDQAGPPNLKGLSRIRRHGHDGFCLSGSGFGFSCEMSWYPELGIGLVVLSNRQDSALPAELADELVARLAGPAAP